jgi:Cu+-exporting ATPase
MEGMDLAGQKTVSFRVTGFTCITCAVGLETLLQRERGVIQAKASYPGNMASITYRPGLTSEANLAGFIQSAGFKASKEV